MQDLEGSHTVCVSARPARENVGFELRAMCMDTAGSTTQPYKILLRRTYLRTASALQGLQTLDLLDNQRCNLLQVLPVTSGR